MQITNRLNPFIGLFHFSNHAKPVQPIKSLLGLALSQVLNRRSQSRNLLPKNLRERRAPNRGRLFEDAKRIAPFYRMVLAAVSRQDHPAVIASAKLNTCLISRTDWKPASSTNVELNIFGLMLSAQKCGAEGV